MPTEKHMASTKDNGKLVETKIVEMELSQICEHEIE